MQGGGMRLPSDDRPLPNFVFVTTFKGSISFDPLKRDKTLVERGLDFLDAATAFQSTHLEVEDTRRPYGETRFICYAMLRGRLIVIVYVPRGSTRDIISMRKANGRERARFAVLDESHRP